jgi:hypothetical protein
MRLIFGSALLTLSLVGCDDAKDALETDTPQTSYCESLCDWAVGCAETERDIDAATMLANCEAATAAIDSSCAEAEAGTLDPATSAVLTECTDAIAESAAAGECDGFVGSYDDLSTFTPPAECAGQGTDAQSTAEAAQDSTAETNEELCERFTESFCVQLETCIVADLFGGTIPQEIIDTLGQPVDLCISELDTVTQTCVSDGLYEAEEDLTDVNTARQGARECLSGIEDLTCDELFAGEVPELCGASFTSTDTALEFFGALAAIATDYSDASSSK